MINPLLEKLKTIPEAKLSIYLPSVNLKKSEKIITGTGHLFYDNKGNLQLELINENPPTKEEETEGFLTSIFENQQNVETIVFRKDYCYEMSASDQNGYLYHCDCIDISNDYNQIIFSCFFKSNLFVRSDKFGGDLKRKSSIVFKNQYNFDINIEKPNDSIIPHFLEDSHSRIRSWEFTINDLTINYHKDLNQLQLDVVSETCDLNQIELKRLADSLDFAMGVEHKFFYRVTWSNHYEFEVEINRSTKLPLPSCFIPPYLRTGSYGDEHIENAKLFKAYYNYLKVNPSNILTKWHKRIVDSGTGYYYNYGLIVSICIEELLVTFYPKEKVSPELFNAKQKELIEVKQKIRECSKKIKDEALRTEFNNICAKLGESKYIPKKMLIKLEKEKKISIGSSKSWEKLRNKYTHGKDYNDNMLKAHGLVGNCLTIYYELVFNVIAYSGYYINSSKSNLTKRLYYTYKTETNQI